VLKNEWPGLTDSPGKSQHKLQTRTENDQKETTRQLEEPEGHPDHLKGNPEPREKGAAKRKQKRYEKDGPEGTAPKKREGKSRGKGLAGGNCGKRRGTQKLARNKRGKAGCTPKGRGLSERMIAGEEKSGSKQDSKPVPCRFSTPTR